MDNRNIRTIILSVSIMMFAYLIWIMYQSYSMTNKLSYNGSSIAQEITSSIKELQEDSSRAYEDLIALTKLETLIQNTLKTINDNREKLVINYSLDASDFRQIIRVEMDSVYSTDFNNYLSEKIRKAMNQLESLSSIYNDFYTINNFDDEEFGVSYSNEQYNKLAFAYFQIFRIPKTNYRYQFVYKLDVNNSISQFKTYSKENFSTSLNAWISKLQQILSEVSDKVSGLRNINQTNFAKIQQLKNEMEGMNRLGRDKTIITIALPIFAALIILLFVVPYIYRSVQIVDSDGSTSTVMNEIFSKGLLLKIFTVFLLTIAIILLALGDKIQGETIGTLLGGISVYILQNSFGKSDDKNGNAPT